MATRRSDKQRDDFANATRRTLAARAGYRCSLCNAPTSGPGHDSDKSVNLGVAAHITAASPLGPRRDHRLTPEERRSPHNAIWLCQNCAKHIDSDPTGYPEDELRRKKSEAEDRARDLLAKPGRSLSPALSPTYWVPELPPQGVIGREREIAEILALLAVGHETHNVPPLAIRGMGGIGKTTLAIALGREKRVSDFFSGGILWTELGPSPNIYDLLKSWSQELGISLPPGSDLAEYKSRLRGVLSKRRALLIIDDVWQVSSGKCFFVGGPLCRVVITTRELPIAHELATQERTHRLDLLSPKSSLELLRKIAPDAVASNQAVARKLCEKLEFLPLGLKLAGHLLANESGVPSRMARLIDELLGRTGARLDLTQPQGRLGLDKDRQASLRAILGLSVERLSKEDRDRFAMLAVFGGEPLWWSLDAAHSVWGCSREETEETTSHLIQRGLIERRLERYWMHALLHDYAVELERDMAG